MAGLLGINPIISDVPRSLGLLGERSALDMWPGLQALIDRNREVLESGEQILNDDKSISTVRSIGVNHPNLNEGRATLIPSIWGGKQLTEKDAIARAIGYAKERNIKWPSFDNHDESTAAAIAASELMRTK